MTAPQVTAIKLHRKSQRLELTFADGLHTQLTAEFLRVHSPSAEVQGHGQPILVEQKASVQITAIEPVGHYAIRLKFDDGHDSGLYSWSWLHHLSSQKDQLWQHYQLQLQQKAALQIPISVNFDSD